MFFVFALSMLSSNCFIFDRVHDHSQHSLRIPMLQEWQSAESDARTRSSSSSQSSSSKVKKWFKDYHNNQTCWKEAFPRFKPSSVLLKAVNWIGQPMRSRTYSQICPKEMNELLLISPNWLNRSPGRMPAWSAWLSFTTCSTTKKGIIWSNYQPNKPAIKSQIKDASEVWFKPLPSFLFSLPYLWFVQCHCCHFMREVARWIREGWFLCSFSLQQSWFEVVDCRMRRVRQRNVQASVCCWWQWRGSGRSWGRRYGWNRGRDRSGLRWICKILPIRCDEGGEHTSAGERRNCCCCCHSSLLFICWAEMRACFFCFGCVCLLFLLLHFINVHFFVFFGERDAMQACTKEQKNKGKAEEGKEKRRIHFLCCKRSSCLLQNKTWRKMEKNSFALMKPKEEDWFRRFLLYHFRYEHFFLFSFLSLLLLLSNHENDPPLMIPFAFFFLFSILSVLPSHLREVALPCFLFFSSFCFLCFPFPLSLLFVFSCFPFLSLLSLFFPLFLFLLFSLLIFLLAVFHFDFLSFSFLFSLYFLVTFFLLFLPISLSFVRSFRNLSLSLTFLVSFGFSFCFFLLPFLPAFLFCVPFLSISTFSSLSLHPPGSFLLY